MLSVPTRRGAARDLVVGVLEGNAVGRRNWLPLACKVRTVWMAVFWHRAGKEGRTNAEAVAIQEDGADVREAGRLWDVVHLEEHG